MHAGFFNHAALLGVQIANPDDTIMRGSTLGLNPADHQFRRTVAHMPRAACRERCPMAKIPAYSYRHAHPARCSRSLFSPCGNARPRRHRSRSDGMIPAKHQRQKTFGQRTLDNLSEVRQVSAISARYLARFSPNGISSGCFTSRLPMSSTCGQVSSGAFAVRRREARRGPYRRRGGSGRGPWERR